MATKTKRAGAPPPNPARADDPERARVAEISDQIFGWRRWGPYVSDRSWATVREDYSRGRRRLELPDPRPGPQQGLPLGRGRHRRHLRPLPVPRASPRRFWNGRDPHPQGAPLRPDRRRGQPRRGRQGVLLPPRQHADALLHALLYKYPQAEFPYRRLVEENQRRAGQGAEFELLDTGIFDEDRYFDIDDRVRQGRRPRTRASGSPPSTAAPSRRRCTSCPHLWFRNIWAWGPVAGVRRRASSRAAAGDGGVAPDRRRHAV